MNEKTLMVSVGCYKKLCRLQTKLEKIFNKKISFGKIIETLIAVEVDWSQFLRDD